MNSSSDRRHFLRCSRLLGLALCWVSGAGVARGDSNYTPYAFTTVAGAAGIGSVDATGENARFNRLAAVAVDSAGNAYVADTGNSTIRKITPAGAVTTLAGLANVTGSADGIGSAARFFNPAGIAVDGAGNLYVADTGDDTIRKVSADGTVVTLAGLAGSGGFADGTGSAARFLAPVGITLDASGNLFVSDYGGNTIRKVTPAGVVTTLAGQGMAPSAGRADGTGAAARFYLPYATAVDSSGVVYVADSANSVIRRITADGVVTTLAGTAGLRGTSDGTGTAAEFNHPLGVALDSAGDLYVADTGNYTIRKVTPAGVVTTVAGQAGVAGTGDGTGTAASFVSPTSLAVDSSGNLYVTDTNSETIRKITAAGVVSTFAGQAGVAGSVDGSGTAALFYSPHGIAVDAANNLYVADSSSDTIRKITAAGAVTTLAGLAGYYGTTDGKGTAALFYRPQSVAADSSGDLYVADAGNETIRKVTADGVVTTLAGKAGISGALDATGTDAEFQTPLGLSVDSSGNVYVADSGNNLIRKISPAGVVTVLAGSAGNAGHTDGTGVAASFYEPAGLTTDAAGNVYVADSGNDSIRKIAADGTVTTVAGSAVDHDNLSRDGDVHVARFNAPGDVAVDSSGTLYVADTGNSKIRVVSTDGTVSTLAGSSGLRGLTDGVGASALFNKPQGLALDSSGILYVADTYNNAVRKITPDGVVTTFAGATVSQGSTNGTGSAARFDSPHGVAVDASGNVFVADSGNDTIRRVTQEGVVTTFAGTAGNSGTTDGTGTAARFDAPYAVATDASGNVYVADTFNYTIRKITPDGVVTTLAGTAGTAGSTDDTGTDIGLFGLPYGVAVDGTGNVYVADATNNTIRRVTPDGVVTTLAGSAGTAGSADGTGTNAYFSSPSGLAVDASGNVFVADSGNDTIRKVTSEGVVTTLAGQAGTSGSVDGIGTAALFSFPSGLAVDASDNLYVTDSGNRTIRKITSDGVVTTLAAVAGGVGFTDGVGSAARFSSPFGITLDAADNLYVADSGNNTVRMITPAGVVTTLAGSGRSTSKGNADGQGDQARFNEPNGVAVDGSGNLYVADMFNSTIRKITPDGSVTTLAGEPGTLGSTNGTGAAALFVYPLGVTCDSAGTVYVADTYDSAIRKITPDGVVTTLAGLTGTAGSLDGTGSAAYFYAPSGVAVDSSGNVFVADTGNDTIRKVTPDGVVSTLAGTADVAGSADGVGSAARFNGPMAVAVDDSDDVYVADTGNETIRKITSDGTVTTLAGSVGSAGSKDGSGVNAWFYSPYGIAVDQNGNVYVADTDNCLIRKISPAGFVTTLGGAPGVNGSADGTGVAARFNWPAGVAVDSSGNLYVADTFNNTIRKGVSTGSGSTTSAPAILTQPQSQTVTAGSSVSFSVTALGEPAPTYQWYLGGSAISGATSDVLTLSSVTSSDAGSYTVVVSNTGGDVTSNAAILTVTGDSSSSGTSGGGGGALPAWFVLILAGLGATRFSRRDS